MIIGLFPALSRDATSIVTTIRWPTKRYKGKDTSRTTYRNPPGLAPEWNHHWYHDLVYLCRICLPAVDRLPHTLENHGPEKTRTSSGLAVAWCPRVQSS